MAGTKLKKATSRAGRTTGQVTVVGLIIGGLEQFFPTAFTAGQLLYLAGALQVVVTFVQNVLEANALIPVFLETPTAPVAQEATKPDVS